MNTTLALDAYVVEPATTTPQGLVLTEGQTKAMNDFFAFLGTPTENVFVISGYSGCGKSTLVTALIDRLPGYFQVMRLVDPSYKPPMLELTATTNKAAENFARITGHPVRTIQSLLSLRVQTDYRTQETRLIPTTTNPVVDLLLFIDEASYIDSNLMSMIFKLTVNCKIVFIGDPAQLTPVKASDTPVFNAGFPEAHLNQVVRQAEGNPIVTLATQFRHTVNTGEWLSFKPDGHHVQWLDRNAFNQAIEAEFSRPDWNYHQSKILAWTNKRVVMFNQYIRNVVKGDPHFQVGDYAICNSYVQVGRHSIKTDQMVEITAIDEDSVRCGVYGNWFEVDNHLKVFVPKHYHEAEKAKKEALADERYGEANEIANEWADLRAAYAQTINKSQGSTYDKVYIDLDDIRRCNSGDQIARMLYVGVSRARHQVILTGDLA